MKWLSHEELWRKFVFRVIRRTSWKYEELSSATERCYLESTKPNKARLIRIAWDPPVGTFSIDAILTPGLIKRTSGKYVIRVCWPQWYEDTLREHVTMGSSPCAAHLLCLFIPPLDSASSAP
ncbi:hypothetical protein VNO77_44195 [Canavalia gladiata]|uniref:Uncharacterized protein n=1 Tax=Canavalia gladiata TaxID=3824 RepID=A0AAN9JXS0_CANGL